MKLKSKVDLQWNVPWQAGPGFCSRDARYLPEPKVTVGEYDNYELSYDHNDGHSDSI